jgi:hypothetical protein
MLAFLMALFLAAILGFRPGARAPDATPAARPILLAHLPQPADIRHWGQPRKSWDGADSRRKIYLPFIPPSCP